MTRHLARIEDSGAIRLTVCGLDVEGRQTVDGTVLAGGAWENAVRSRTACPCCSEFVAGVLAGLRGSRRATRTPAQRRDVVGRFAPQP